MTRKMYLSQRPGIDGWDDMFGSWQDNESAKLSPYGKAVLYNWFKANDVENNDEYKSYINNGYSSLPEDWRVALRWTDEWYNNNPNVSYQDYLNQIKKANSLYWDQWEKTPEGKFGTATGTSRRRDPSNLNTPFVPVEVDVEGPLSELMQQNPQFPWDDNSRYPAVAGPWDPNDFGTYEEEDVPMDEIDESYRLSEEHPEWTYDGIYQALIQKYPELTPEEADRMTWRRLNSL